MKNVYTCDIMCNTSLTIHFYTSSIKPMFIYHNAHEIRLILKIAIFSYRIIITFPSDLSLQLLPPIYSVLFSILHQPKQVVILCSILHIYAQQCTRSIRHQYLRCVYMGKLEIYPQILRYQEHEHWRADQSFLNPLYISENLLFLKQFNKSTVQTLN